MADAQVDTSLKYIVEDPCIHVDGAQTRIVKIQNVASELWACGVATERHIQPPIVVEPDSLQYDAFEWKLILVDRERQYYYIQHVATGKYAWDPAYPEGDEDVLLGERRLWKIKHTGDGHYMISPAGIAENDLFWTDVTPTPGSNIKLEGPTMGEKSHWRFIDVNEDDISLNLTKLITVVKIKHVPSELWAAALPIPKGVDVQKVWIVVEPEKLQKEEYETWILTRVDHEWYRRHGSDGAQHKYGGDVEKKVAGHYYLIENVGTCKYAWDPEPPAEHTPVYQSDGGIPWKIMRQADGHYIISRAGETEDELFWTSNADKGAAEVNSEIQLPITLEKPSGEKHHWILHEVKRECRPKHPRRGEV